MRVRVTARGFVLRAFVLSLVLAVIGGALPAFADVPDRPIDLGMENWGPNAADGIPCATGPDRPSVFTPTPRLRARVFSGTGSTATAGFRVYTGTADDHTWNGEDLLDEFVPSDSYAQTTVPDGRLVEGGVYTWQAWQGSPTGPGGFSELCEFVVDSTPPHTPSVTSRDYPVTGLNGSIGHTGAFTFTSDDAADVVKYEWSLYGSGSFLHFVSAVGGTATALVTPKFSGRNRLYVYAFDRAGNRSPVQAEYEFDVAGPTAPTSAWELDETGGTTAADTGGGNRPLTLTGGATFGAGHAGNALVVDGGFATTGTAVLDPARAFSIAAWVKLDDTSTSRTVVSQDGAVDSAFALRYDATANRWAATARGSEPVSAFSADPPETGEWTFLAGTYEPNTRKLSLYVDSSPEGTALLDVPSAPSGPLVVGAAQVAGVRAEQFAGSIDQVVVWDRLITAAEIANQGNAAKLLTRYAFDDQGTATGDSVGGQVATLSGGVTRAGDDAAKWVHFDSTATGRISAPKPVKLKTDRSYSVSAWVRADSFGRVSRTAVATDSAENSSFALGYVPRINRWTFTLTIPGGATWSAYSNSAPTVATWTHLTGVYDSSTGGVALYVNGVRQNLENGGAPGIPVADDLIIGHGKKNGAPADFWTGDVDDVMVHSGALTAAEAVRVYDDTRHS